MRKRMVGAIGSALLAVGCGASDDYANDPRPPRPVNLAISVTDRRVAVSPGAVGAGPAVLIVKNGSGRSRDVRLTQRPGSDSACVEADASTGPINPGGTGQLKVDLVEGECVVAVRRKPGPPRAAALEVGRERPSAQADLLLP